jgi:hypothetical protein
MRRDLSRLAYLIGLTKKWQPVYWLFTVLTAGRNFAFTYLSAYLSRTVVASAREGRLDTLWSGFYLFLIALAVFLVLDTFALYMQPAVRGQNVPIILEIRCTENY